MPELPADHCGWDHQRYPEGGNEQARWTESQLHSLLYLPRLFISTSPSSVPLNASSGLVFKCLAQLGVWTQLCAGDWCLQLPGQRGTNLHSDFDGDMEEGSLEFNEDSVGTLKRSLL